MRRNSPLPLLVLGLLTLLVAGAIVLGLVQAPTTPDLTVHNGAGEVVNASSLTYVLTSSTAPGEAIRVTYQAPDRVTEEEFRGALTGRPVRTASADNARAKATVLRLFKDLQGLSGFSPRGSGFVASQPVSSLVPRDEARDVSGAYDYTATVTGGYLARLIVRYHYTTPAGSESGTDRYRVTRVGGQRVATAT